MKLVVDTNILFSFFKKEAKTRKLILNSEILEPVTPSFCIDELNEHKELICKKSRLSDRGFEEVLDDLLIFVKVFSLFEYKDFLSDAKTLSPDPDDIDLFALALKLDCPIWAQEKSFKKQSKVKVFSTNLFLERKALPKEFYSFLAQVLSLERKCFLSQT